VPPKRSPILGYNHNVRHRGLVFHVQTEDSGVDNPHVFTHVFNGGVILASRKLDYDPGSAEESVKALMQSQHKALLKELRGGSLDEKIDRYLVGNKDLLPRAGAAAPGPEAASPGAALSSEAAAAAEEAAALAAAEAAEKAAAAAEAADKAAAAEAALAAAEAAAAAARREDAAPIASISVTEEMTRPEALVLDDDAGLAAPAKRIQRDTLHSAPVFRVEGESDRPTIRRAAVRPQPDSDASAGQQGGGERALPEIDSVSLRAPRPPKQREPGAVEFRPPTGEFKRPSAAELMEPSMITPADLAARDDLSAAFRAIRSDGTEQDDERTDGGSNPGSGEFDANKVPTLPGGTGPDRSRNLTGEYIHTRSGRPGTSPGTPTEIEDGPTERHDSVTGLAGRPAARPRRPAEPPQTRTRFDPPTASPRAPGGAQPAGKARTPRAAVVVSRPSVIVGAPPKIVGRPPAAPARAPKGRAGNEPRGGLFGKDLISEASLDEVILAYLSEDPDEK
jgi:hypothetical protein